MYKPGCVRKFFLFLLQEELWHVRNVNIIYLVCGRYPGMPKPPLQKAVWSPNRGYHFDTPQTDTYRPISSDVFDRNWESAVVKLLALPNVRYTMNYIHFRRSSPYQLKNIHSYIIMHFLRYLFISVHTWFLLYTCHKIAKCSHTAVITCQYGFYTYFYTMHE
jgi:hypothetical protein